jgi:MFS family permease
MDRGGLVRRNTVLLTAAHGVAQVGLPVVLIVGVPAASRMTGHDWASGLVWAVSLGSGAVGALVLGGWMDRAGRRPGLQLAYLAMAAGGAGAAASLAASWFPGLLASSALLGAGSGGANLARGAVADMYPPDRRGRLVGFLVAAGVIGAIGGPLLIPVVRDMAEARNADPSVPPWGIPILGGVVSLLIVSMVRPDPRDLAHEEEDEPSGDRATPRRPKELLHLPAFRTAALAVVAAQMAMVGVMGVTPNALEHRGHAGHVPWIISAHVAGMYAFAPLVGALLDRWGRRPAMVAGLAVTLGGALGAATEASPAVVGAGLFAIGLGWSATYLTVTATISDLTVADERSGALGFSDLLVQAASALAALAGGVVLDVAGYGTLGVAAGVLLAVTLAVIVAGLPGTKVAVATATAER